MKLKLFYVESGNQKMVRSTAAPLLGGFRRSSPNLNRRASIAF